MGIYGRGIGGRGSHSPSGASNRAAGKHLLPMPVSQEMVFFASLWLRRFSTSTRAPSSIPTALHMILKRERHVSYISHHIPTRGISEHERTVPECCWLKKVETSVTGQPTKTYSTMTMKQPISRHTNQVSTLMASCLTSISKRVAVVSIRD